jgi:hypothetical protein
MDEKFWKTSKYNIKFDKTYVMAYFSEEAL